MLIYSFSCMFSFFFSAFSFFTLLLGLSLFLLILLLTLKEVKRRLAQPQRKIKLKNKILANSADLCLRVH